MVRSVEGVRNGGNGYVYFDAEFSNTATSEGLQRIRDCMNSSFETLSDEGLAVLGTHNIAEGAPNSFVDLALPEEAFERALDIADKLGIRPQEFIANLVESSLYPSGDRRS